MKRSNILLTGLLIAIFIVPLGMFMAFKRMVHEGAYTAKIDREKDHLTKGKTGVYRVVKIMGPDLEITDNRRVLTCHLHSAEKGYYHFRRLNTIDSISVTNAGDTLFINYVTKRHPGVRQTYYTHYNIDLYLPDMKDIIVNGATLQIDTIDRTTNPDIHIRLTDAILQLGDGINKHNSHRIPKDTLDSDFERIGTPLKYNNLSVNATASQLLLGHHLQIDSLSLVTDSSSKLTVANDFQVHHINGRLAGQSTIVSNIRVAKKLSRLATE